MRIVMTNYVCRDDDMVLRYGMRTLRSLWWCFGLWFCKCDITFGLPKI